MAETPNDITSHLQKESNKNVSDVKESIEDENPVWRKQVCDYYESKNKDGDNDEKKRQHITTKTDIQNDADNDDGDNNSVTDPWPLRDIKEPTDNDVIFGRGGGTNHHKGNKKYRKLIDDHKATYNDAKRLDKPLIALQIIKSWRNKQNPPGRFIKQDSKTNLWHDVGDIKARKKTSQALREKPKSNTGLSSYQKKKLLLKQQQEEQQRALQEEQAEASKEIPKINQGESSGACSNDNDGENDDATPVETDKNKQLINVASSVDDDNTKEEDTGEEQEVLAFSADEYLWEEAIQRTIQHSVDVIDRVTSSKVVNDILIGDGYATVEGNSSTIPFDSSIIFPDNSTSSLPLPMISSSMIEQQTSISSLPMISLSSLQPIPSVGSIIGREEEMMMDNPKSDENFNNKFASHPVEPSKYEGTIAEETNTGDSERRRHQQHSTIVIKSDENSPLNKQCTIPIAAARETLSTPKRITSHQNETEETKPDLKITTAATARREEAEFSSDTVCYNFSSIKRAALNNRNGSLRSQILKAKYLPNTIHGSTQNNAAQLQEHQDEVGATIGDDKDIIRALSTATQQMHLDNDIETANTNATNPIIPLPPPTDPLTTENRTSTADAIMPEFTKATTSTTIAQQPQQQPLDFHKETSFSAWTDEDPSSILSTLLPSRREESYNNDCSDNQKHDRLPLVRARS